MIYAMLVMRCGNQNALDICIVKYNAASSEVSIEIRAPADRFRAFLRTRNERGQALLETALILPVLLLMITGIFTFGIAINNYLMLTNSVSIGGRELSVSRGQTTDPCALASAKIYGAAPLLTPSKFSFTFVFNGTSYPGASCSSSSTTTGAAGNLLMGTTAQVTASYPCDLSVYGLNLAPSCALKAQIAEVVQ
jgi:Flp pilus assembly protein TadG